MFEKLDELKAPLQELVADNMGVLINDQDTAKRHIIQHRQRHFI